MQASNRDDGGSIDSASSVNHDRDSSGASTPIPTLDEKTLDQIEASAPTTESPSPEPGVEKTGPAYDREAEENYKPKTLKFWLIIVSTLLSTFIVALDRTILSTAIPKITDDFNSLGDIGWYGSAYMLTTAAFQLVFGRLYRFYDLKWTLLYSIIVFEIGSVICASAPSSPVFIFGRSVAGMGSAGIMTGGMLVLIPMVPLHKRPMFQGMSRLDTHLW